MMHAVIDALAALDAPRPDDVARAAATEHRGTFAAGPLASVR